MVVYVAAGEHVDWSDVVLSHASSGSLVHASRLTFGSGNLQIQLVLLEQLA